MSKVVSVLDSYLDLTPQDERELQVFFDSLERDQRTVAVQSVVSSGASQVVAGNVEIDWTKGITLYNPTSGQRTIYLDPDGDAWFGKNTEVAAETALSVFANAQDYNGEEFGAGDVLLGDNSSSKANLLWDQSTGQLKLRSGTTDGIILDTDGSMQSGNYSSEASGWRIGADGDAEFNSIVARGTLRASVFQYESLSAVGGHFLVSKSAAEVATDVTTDTTFTLELKNDDEGGVLVASGDILEIKSWNGSEIIDVFVTAGTVTDNGDTASFTATLQSGGTGKLLQRGMGVANLGPSGSGMIRLQAGDIGDASVPTRMSIQTHAGSPWSALTDQLVLGDLYNTYGAGANHRYGVGIGDYSSENFLTYNSDGAGGFKVQAGNGAVSLTESGIDIEIDATQAWSAPKSIDWWRSTTRKTSIYTYGASDSAQLWLEIPLQSENTSQNAIVLKTSAPSGAIGAQVNLIAVKGSSQGQVILSENTFFVDTNTLLSADSTVQVTGTSVPSSGTGLELYWNGSASRILSYNRGGDTYQPLDFISSKFQFLEGTTTLITIDNGDIWTQDFTNYSGSTTVGWSSLSTKKIYYKTIGDWVFIQFELYGTANNATTTFTVPYSNNGSIQAEGVMRCDDVGGAASFGMCILPLSSNVVTLYRDPALTAWSATGTKWASGQFWYQRA